MPYFALDTILLGSTSVEAGEEVPATYVDMFGDQQHVDLDRLVEIGAAEKARKASATAGAPEPPAEDAPEPGEPPAED